MAEKQNGLPGAEALMKDKEKLRQVLASPEVRQLAAVLNTQSGGQLRHAARSAQSGDTAQLEQMMRALGASQEGAKLMEQLQKMLGK